MNDLLDRVQEVLHADVLHTSHLSGGCVGDVRRLELNDGRAVVAKIRTSDTSELALEGFMLRFLAANSNLPVPEVFHADNSLLLMSFISGDETIGAQAQEDAAHHVAALHKITAPEFGFSCDTLVGGLSQPNPNEESWLDFFRDHRLMSMGQNATDAGRLPVEILSRLETMCAHLEKWLTEPPAASLLHGDMWTGNVLVKKSKIAGFVDPAIYYGDPEIELAFTTMFGTFGDAFFHRYEELRGIAPGFFEERRDIYNLYPLLVHVRLFGETYIQSIDNTLRKFGF